MSPLSQKSRNKAAKARQRAEELREAMEEVSVGEEVIDLCSQDYIQVDSEPQ